MKLVLAGRWSDDAEREAWAAALRNACPRHELLQERGAHAASIEAAIVANPPPGSLQGLPKLRLIQSLWAGVDKLLADASLPAGVPIARMVDPAMTAAMAETALWAVLALQRGFFDYAAAQRAGQWTPLPQRRADETPVLLLGAGQMGGAVAARLEALGYPLTLWRRSAAAPLHAALAQARIVVNLLPLTPQTRGLIDARFLAALPRGAAVVNLARGAHVVDDDLLAALDDGHIAHAVLDVFHTEPLPTQHRYWQHPRVTLLPHVAALTDPRSAAQVVAANIDALAAGLPLAHLVDRQRGY